MPGGHFAPLAFAQVGCGFLCEHLPLSSCPSERAPACDAVGSPCPLPTARGLANSGACALSGAHAFDLSDFSERSFL